MACFISKAMPANDTEYNCHAKFVAKTCLATHSHRVHTMPLIINSIRAETHTHTADRSNLQTCVQASMQFNNIIVYANLPYVWSCWLLFCN